MQPRFVPVVATCGTLWTVVLFLLAIRPAAGQEAQPAAAASGGELIWQFPQHYVVEGIVCSPDGRFVATASQDRTVAIWDAATGDKLRVDRGPTTNINSLAISADGTLLATGDDQELIVRKFSSGEIVHRCRDTTDDFTSLAFSPDGKLLLAGRSQHEPTVQLWSVSEGKVVRELEGAGWIGAVAFSPNGAMVAAGDHDGAITVWETVSGAKLHQFPGTLDYVTSLAFSPDGQRLAVAAFDNSSAGVASELALWEVARERKLRSTSDARRSYSSVAFLPDGKSLVSGGRHLEDDCGELRLWNDELDHQRSVQLPGSYELEQLALHPDRKRLFTADGSQLIEYQLDPWEKSREFGRECDLPEQIAGSPQGPGFLCQYKDRLLWWEPAAGQPRLLATRAPDGHFRWCTLTPDGATALTWQVEGKVEDKDDAQSHRLLRIELATGAVQRGEAYAERYLYGSVLSRNGRFLAAAGTNRSGSVALFDAFTGKVLRRFDNLESSVSVDLTADGTRIITASGQYDSFQPRDSNASSNGSDEASNQGEPKVFVRVWDAATGNELQRLPRSSVRSLAFAPDGKRAIIGRAGELEVWHLDTGVAGKKLTGINGIVSGLTFSRDGARLATQLSGNDHTITLWDAAEWKRLVDLPGHDASLLAAEFVNQDRCVLSASYDRTIRLWDTQTGSELAKLIVWEGGQDWLIATPDGRLECSPGAVARVRVRTGAELAVAAADAFVAQHQTPGLLGKVFAESDGAGDRQKLRNEQLALSGELAKQGKLDEALAACEKALATKFQVGPVLLQRGWLHNARGEWTLALADYDAALVAMPDELSALALRADLLSRLSLHDRAAADFTRLMELRPDQASVFRRKRAAAWAAAGRYSEAIEEYSSMLEATPRVPDLLLGRGQSRFELADFHGAAEDAAAINKIFPRPLPDAVVLRARALVKTDQADLALAELDQIVARSNQAAPMRLIRAGVLSEAGRHEPALAEYDAILTANPKAAAVLVQRAAAQKRRANYQAALADLNAAIENDARAAGAHAARAWLLATCPEATVRNGNQAVADAQMAIALVPATTWRELNTLAAAQAEAGDLAAAVKSQQAALEAAMSLSERAELQARLQLYQSGQPFREARPDPNAVAAKPVPSSSSPTTPSPSDLQPDRFELKLGIPEGATVQMNGQEQGAKTIYSWQDLSAEQTQVAQVRVQFADGEEAQRTVLVQGGRRLELAIRAPSRLVYELETYNDGELHTQLVAALPDGRNPRRITPADRPGYHPRISPDGTMVAVHSRDDDGRETIYLVNMDGSNPRSLVLGLNVKGMNSPAWSPDGSHIAFHAWSAGEYQGAVYVIDRASGQVVRLAEGSDPSWSADGQRLLFRFTNILERNAEGGITKRRPELKSISASGGEAKVVTIGEHGRWSPDGQRLAFFRDGDGPHNSLLLADADGANERLVTNKLFLLDFAWSPEATRVVFSEGESLTIHDVIRQTTQTIVTAQRTKQAEAFFVDPCWSPDGGRIAFVREVYNAVDGEFEEFPDEYQLQVIDLARDIVRTIRTTSIGGEYVELGSPDWR